MGPPGFNECYICHREFGSRSLEIHEPQCLAKWRRSNKSLPKTERQRTPSPPSDRNKHTNVRGGTHPSASSEDSSPDGSSRKRAPNSPKFMERRKLTRPTTATLNKPKVLNPRMKDEIDMSEMSRQMMESLVLQKDNPKGSSDYSSDFSSSSSSSSSMSTKSPYEEEQDEASSGDSESESNRRPSTMRLRRPTSHISIPVITPSNTRPLPRRGKTATIRRKMTLKNRLLTEEILGHKDKIPEPCLTCGKEQNPERFHSHPRHLPKFKAKNKHSRDRNNQEQPKKSISKVAVTKPPALKYKSRSLESSPEAHHISNSKHVEKTSTNTKFKGKSKSRSAENSPKNKVKTEVDPKNKSKNKSKIKNRFSRVGDAFAGQRESSLGNSKKHSQIPSTKRTDDKNEEGTLGSNGGLENLRTVKSSMSPVERAGTAPLKLCYICCREFGSRSLGIHEPQCLEKWRRENNCLPDHLKREEPKRPSKELSKDEWNEYAWNMAQSQLVPCENCGRTFKPDRLEVHQRGCKPPPGFKKSQERKDSASPKIFYRPTVVCFICGREFGSRSIAIHEPQCLAKWKNENDKLPQHLQRPEPVKPETVLDGDGRVDQQAMAEAAWRSHLDTLVKCEGCDRTFFPDRLAVHQKSCKSLNN